MVQAAALYTILAATLAAGNPIHRRAVDKLNDAATKEAHPRDDTATRALSNVQITTADGKCLFVDALSGDFRANLTPLQISDCGSNKGGQGFDVITKGVHNNVNGQALIVSTLTQACLSFDPRRAADSQVHLFSCGGRADGGGQVANSQLFAFDGKTNAISLTPQNSPGKCLVTAGAQVVIGDCNANDPKQQFTLGGNAGNNNNGGGNGGGNGSQNTNAATTTGAATQPGNTDKTTTTLAITPSAPAASSDPESLCSANQATVTNTVTVTAGAGNGNGGAKPTDKGNNNGGKGNDKGNNGGMGNDKGNNGGKGNDKGNNGGMGNDKGNNGGMGTDKGNNGGKETDKGTNGGAKTTKDNNVTTAQPTVTSTANNGGATTTANNGNNSATTTKAAAGGQNTANPTTPVPVSRAGGTLNPSAAAEAHEFDKTAVRARESVNIRAPDGRCVSIDPTAGDFRQNLIPVGLAACSEDAGQKFDIVTAGKHNDGKQGRALVVSSLMNGCLSFDNRRAAGDTVTIFSCGGRAAGEGETNASQLYPFVNGNDSIVLQPGSDDLKFCLVAGRDRLDSAACDKQNDQVFEIVDVLDSTAAQLQAGQ